MVESESNGSDERRSALARLRQRRADRAAEDAHDRDLAFAELEISNDTQYHLKDPLHHPNVAPPVRLNPRCARVRSKAQQVQKSDELGYSYQTNTGYSSSPPAENDAKLIGNSADGQFATRVATSRGVEDNISRMHSAIDISPLGEAQMEACKSLEEEPPIEDVEEAMRQLLDLVQKRTAALDEAMELAPERKLTDLSSDLLAMDDVSGNGTSSAYDTPECRTHGVSSQTKKAYNFAQIRTDDCSDEFDLGSEDSLPSPSRSMTEDDEGRLWESAQRDVMRLLASPSNGQLSPVAESTHKAIAPGHMLPEPQDESIDESQSQAAIEVMLSITHPWENGACVNAADEDPLDQQIYPNSKSCSHEGHDAVLVSQQSRNISSDNDNLTRMSFRYLRFCLSRCMREAAAQKRAEKRAPLEAAIQRHMDALHDADKEPAARRLQTEWRKYRMRKLFHRMDLAARRVQRFFRRRWLRHRLEREAPLERERLDNERRRKAMAPPPPPSRRPPQNREPQPKSVDPYCRNPQAWHAPRGTSALLACPPPLKKPHQPKNEHGRPSPTINNGNSRAGEPDGIPFSRSQYAIHMDAPQLVEATSVQSPLSIPPPPRAWPPRSDMSQRVPIEVLTDEAFAQKHGMQTAATTPKKRGDLIAAMSRGKVCKGQSIKSMLPSVAINDAWTISPRVLGSPRRKLDIL